MNTAISPPAAPPRIHILVTTAGWTRPRVASSFFTGITPADKLFTSCCACRVRADHTLVSNERIKARHEGYYDPQQRIVCRAGKGCNAKPSMRRGMALRIAMHWGW